MVGGRNKNNKNLASGEMFDLQRNIWRNIPDMNVARWTHALVAAKGALAVCIHNVIIF